MQEEQAQAELRPAGSGLCGNFNGDTTDDFTTSVGIAEGTASLFVDSWRAGNCPVALERETDPCSMSQLNSECPAPNSPWLPPSTHSSDRPLDSTTGPAARVGGPWEEPWLEWGGAGTHTRACRPQRCVRRPTVPCC